MTDALECANNTAGIRTFREHTVACGMTPTITLAQALLAEDTSSSLAPLCVSSELQAVRRETATRQATAVQRTAEPLLHQVVALSDPTLRVVRGEHDAEQDSVAVPPQRAGVPRARAGRG